MLAIMLDRLINYLSEFAIVLDFMSNFQMEIIHVDESDMRFGINLFNSINRK
jgi:hypothetical protein